MIQANSINEVITYLDYIISWSKQKQSRIGYFASLYKKMTVAVKQGITNNQFEDGRRMEMLDIIFANRYLQAWEAYSNKEVCTNAWCTAFDAAAKNNLIVVQHLVLGINTHINLDLAIAAAEVSAGKDIQTLQVDFDNINGVISSLFQNVQDDLSLIWPPLKYVTAIANHRQEAALNFSILAARKASWANALILSTLNKQDKNNYIKKMDNIVVILANRIINPGIGARFAIRLVNEMESKNVSHLIDILQ